MYVLALRIDLRFPNSQSLKQKRTALRPIVDGLRNRFAVSVSEVDHQDSWQRCVLAVALVSGDAGQVRDQADKIERFLWQADDTEVLEVEHHWLDVDR